MKKKLFRRTTALTLTRRIIQVLSIVLFPGLFISAFSAIKSIYVAIIGGSFQAAAMAGQIILVVSVLVITAIMGRFFCGFLCSFGTLGDFFWYIGKKLKLRRPKIGTRFDRILKKLKYVLLAGIVLLIWTFGVSILGGTNNPWTVFGMLTKFSGWTDPAVLLSLGMALLLLIALGSLYIERFFCRYLCPLGAVLAIVSRFRLFKIRKPRQYCGSCRACTKHCSMGIPLYRSSVVKSAECIDCMNCVEICPRDNVRANPKPAIAAAVAVASLGGMYFAGNIAGGNIAQRQIAAVAASVSAAASVNLGPYTSGVYTGSAEGYHGLTDISVTVNGGYIVSVDVQSTGDDKEFFDRAQYPVILNIIRSQSTSVDTVSGATFSSFAIIDAVENALSGVPINTQLNEPAAEPDVFTIVRDTSMLTPEPVLTPSPSPTPSPTPTPSPSPTPEPDGPFAVADGVYTGSGRGHKGTIKVEVTIENGFITAIKIISYRDTERYFTRAKSKTIDRIITAQSTGVDTVSGATQSSEGILGAVEDALYGG